MGAGRANMPDLAWPSEAFIWLGLGVAAFSLSELSLLTPFVEQGTALFWLATGLTMGVLIRLPFHSWPGALGATFLFCLASNLNHSIPLGLSLAFALANVLEAACGVALFTSWTDRKKSHLVVQALLLAAAGAFACGIGAAIGVGSLILTDSVSNISQSVSLWYVADLLGVVLVAPFVLAWWPKSSWSAVPKNRHFELELGLSMVLVLTASYGAFWHDLGPQASMALLYGLFTLLISSGLRLGARGATTTGLCVAAVAVSGTLASHGPFAAGTGELAAQATSLQIYLVASSFAGLIPGLFVSQHAQSEPGALDSATSFTGGSSENASKTRLVADPSPPRPVDPENNQPPSQYATSDILDEIGEIAAGAAHDFNNVLTAIQGSTQLLSFDAQEEQKELIDDILDASRAARELTSRLSSLRREERVQFETFKLARTLSDAQRFLGRLLGEKFRLEVVLPSENLSVHTDPSQLQHMLFLLALQARRSVPSGGAFTLRVTECETEPSDESIQLRVLCEGDNPDEIRNLRSALEPLESSVPALRLKPHPLSASELTRRLGARVAIEGEETNTEVHLLLPRPEKVSRPTACPSPAPSHHLQQRVLVVEDGAELRAPLERLLLRKGFQPTMVSNSEHALELLQEKDFDLLLTDLMMPGMNGQQLRDEVNRIRPALPVLFMSGFGDDALGTRQQGSRAEKLLRKPFTAQELSDAVLEALAGTRPE